MKFLYFIIKATLIHVVLIYFVENKIKITVEVQKPLGKNALFIRHQ